MDYLGLVMELLFLAFGIYLYLFSRGFVQAGSPDARKKAEAFRQRNAWWLRIGALAIIAIMALNLYLHFMQVAGE